MAKHYEKYLEFLAAGYNVLYVGREQQKIFNETEDFFMSVSYVDVNEDILAKLEAILMKRHIDIVVMDAVDNNPLISEFYKKAYNFNNKILFMLLFEPKGCEKLLEIIPRVDTLLAYPLDQKSYYKKLFTLLSHPYTIDSINRRAIVLQNSDRSEDNNEVFFQNYKGSALFLSDDLMEIIKNLEDGNLSADFLNNIAIKIDQIADIFSNTETTSKVTPIFKDFAHYLRSIKLENIEPQNLEGFSYLSNILHDISVYLMDMFVDRIFKDVHVFEDSLKNNINFMKYRLEGREEDGSQMEFFQ